MTISQKKVDRDVTGRETAIQMESTELREEIRAY